MSELHQMSVQKLTEKLEKAEREVALMAVENAELREELKSRQAELERLLSADSPEGNDVSAADAYYQIAEILQVPAGGSVVGQVHKLASELERVRAASAELAKIGELIRTQDNRVTDQPIFVVFQKQDVIADEDYDHDRICWVSDGCEVGDDEAEALESKFHETLVVPDEYHRLAVKEVDQFVTACFTEQGCKDYLKRNGHNLRQPFIYATGSFRNEEYQMVRNWLAALASPAAETEGKTARLLDELQSLYDTDGLYVEDEDGNREPVILLGDALAMVEHVMGKTQPAPVAQQLDIEDQIKEPGQ